MATIIQPFSKFINECAVNLKQRNLTGIAITSANKLLLLCGSDPSRVDIYSDCRTYEDNIELTSPPWGITVVPGTNKAVVTLPGEKSIQFININNTNDSNKIEIGEKIEIGDEGYGVTAVKDSIYIGGKDKVIILNAVGSREGEIQVGGLIISDLLYNEEKDQLLLRKEGRLCCIKLNGNDIYEYIISGHRGLAVDKQGRVYVSGNVSHEIHRLSPDGNLDVVLSNDVHEPRDMTFNNDFTTLFVIKQRGDALTGYGCE